MNVEVTKLPESRVALKIELSPSEVDQVLERTYRQLAQQLTIPGFRRGKAPRVVVERAVGQEYFLHEGTEEAVRWGYRKAVEQANIVPIDEAEITPVGGDHTHIHPGESFSFEATVAVKPEVQLPDYHALRVERETVNVSDADVDDLLRRLQEAHATLEPTVRPAQYGDTLTLNIVARAGAEEVLNDENYEFTLTDEAESGPNPAFPGLSEQLVDANRGDIRDIALTMPDDYRDPELAGKVLALRILVKEVKRPVLPALDDEFAQEISSFQTLDEVKDQLRQNLELERRYEADQKMVSEAVEEVASRTFVEIPPVLIEEELDRMIGDLQNMLAEQRVGWNTYLDVTHKTEEQIRDEMRDAATRNVKTSLVLGAVADWEGIDVSNREITDAIEEILREASVPDAERRKLRASNAVRANIRSRIRRQRAIERLVEVMSGEQVSPEAAEAMADQTAAAAQDTEETVAVEVGS